MINAILEYLILLAIIVVLLFGIANMIKERKSPVFASLTAFLDLQAKDRQAGVEAVIEHQAEKKMDEQESGREKS